MARCVASIDHLRVAAFAIPTDAPESDGTLEWDHTVIVVVHATAADVVGLGYTYADASAASVIDRILSRVVMGHDAMDVESCYNAMLGAVRNLGRPGVVATAIAAVDVALWDLKARLLGVALVALLGGARESVPLYGSGGFTSYTIDQLDRQLGGWAAEGFRAVKMKIGRDASADRDRVRAARAAIGGDVHLFVDANGAYDRKLALAQADAFSSVDVRWFEEPVPSDDIEGLRLIRDRAPAGMDIAAGEYGYVLQDFQKLLQGGAVDVLQADATRCCGITGFLRVGALCDATGLPLSAHTAPAIHLHPCCAVARVRNLEYFHDHARIERLLFDGVVEPCHGSLRPDRSRPGLGLTLKDADASRFAVRGAS